MADRTQSSGILRPLAAIEAFCRQILTASGADRPTAEAATRAMMHGTCHGIDSHGVRLLAHYVKGLVEGRLNPRPKLTLANSLGAVASLDADNAHGALATYTAMDHATRLAGEFGIGAIAVRNSSHFGPAGAYAIDAAERGFIGFAFCNSDSFVRLHDGAMRFHGTNPIACAVPVKGQNPWLFDMATSAVPYNRVQLYRSLGRELPAGVASDERGYDTRDPQIADMLAPLGGEFGFKGAGLAGIAEILSAVLTGMKLSVDIAPMPGPDFSTPRGLGAFVIALKPGAFLDIDSFDAAMTRYLDTLRNSPAREGFKVMAPGDREWAVAAQRQKAGVELDPVTVESFKALGAAYGINAPV
ncbi:Ldh family oxidoreductase [Rhizobium bangladeshense]|uniref:Ldh family oxidoreductase n=1 Tax=Rhizobium bangladeshense TaxID=1138189 RepID=A0ABS7LI60_9HYPH|nr:MULTISPECIES: Ldh family oxidoreductase [Rhizobium]MBX4867257.1 Ldh family oxidoreductase [Rhizobium bangladeshense]MBX4871548.1 Ldh family oxidoreductase [Rhizobium bangladeshense]MBX4882862.1 Ldh family oxidoreductase [Rhizobium bangladeshense]MBX4891252.1 Ldh family oxidoreductase [Rhizobium bangladeshense]MBX4920562.1 Ldh family oxidoreductase [Rhizobium bangladeshense]